MDDARPGTGVAGAGSTGTAVRRQYGPPPVPLIAWSGGRAVFAFGVPFAAGLLLAGVVLLLGVPGGRVALVNGAFAALDGTGVPAPLFAVGAVIAALGLGFGVTAATVVVLAAADDAVAGPRDAWRWSVHHWRLVVEAALVALVAVAVVTATAVWWRAGGWGTVVIVVLLAVGAVIVAPLLLGWALVVAGVPRRSAYRRAWGSGRVIVRGGHEATATPRRALVGGATLVTVLGVGVLLLLRLLPPSALRSSVVVAWCCIAVTGLVLVVVAIAVRGAATRNDGGRLRSPLTTDPVAGGRRARPGLVGAGVVVVPAVVFAVIVSSNPIGVVQYDAAPADARGLLGGDIADVGGRTAVVSTPSTPPSRLRMCGDASCDTPRRDARPDRRLRDRERRRRWVAHRPVEGAVRRRGSAAVRARGRALTRGPTRCGTEVGRCRLARGETGGEA